MGYACPPTANTESVLHQFDVIVRVTCATLLLVAAVALLRRGRRADYVWFAPFALCLCGYLAGNTTVEALQLPGLIGRVGVLLGGFVAVSLWWFCLAVFDWSFRPRGPVLALGLAWMVIASADRGFLGAGLADRGLSWILIVFGCLMMGHLAWRLYRDRDSDLLDRRRRSRLAVVVLLAGILIIDMASCRRRSSWFRPTAFQAGWGGTRRPGRFPPFSAATFYYPGYAACSGGSILGPW